MEQLDQVARWATPLAPIDLAEPGEVKLLVPVPQRWFDPELLIEEQVHPAIFEAFGHAVRMRDSTLTTRAFVRAELNYLEQALAGPAAVTQFPNPDPDALDADEMASAGPFSWEDGAVLTALAAARNAADPLDSSVLDGIGVAIGGPAGALVATAFDPNQRTENIVVVDSIVEDALPLAGVTLDQGWVRPDVVMPLDRPQVHYRSATVYLVAGRIDEEVLDRALEFADDTPLLLVASSLDDVILDRIDRIREDGRIPPLVVLGLRGPRLLEQAEDLAIRLGATRRPLGDEWGVRTGIQEVVVTRRRTWFAGPAQRDASTFVARQQEIEALIATAPSQTEAARLQERWSRFLETVTVVSLIPDPAAPDLRWHEGYRTFVALKRYVDALRGAADAGIDVDWAMLGNVLGGEGLVDPVTVGARGFVSAPYDDVEQALVEPSSRLQDLLPVLGAEGLRGLAEKLVEEIREANEAVDVGTVRIQTDMYRVRKLLLGKDAATRLATSPILAELGELLTSEASSQDVLDLLRRLRDEAANVDPPPPPPGSEGEPPVQTAPIWWERGGQWYQPLGSTLALDSFDRRFGGGLAPFRVEPLRIQPEPLPLAFASRTAPGSPTNVRSAVPNLLGRTGIAERLEQSPTVEARFGSFGTKTATLRSLKNLRMSLSGIRFPLQVPRPRDDGTTDDTFDIDVDADVDRILDGEDDLDTGANDEAGVLSDAIASLETTLTWLRLVEARIPRLRDGPRRRS